MRQTVNLFSQNTLGMLVESLSGDERVLGLMAGGYEPLSFNPRKRDGVWLAEIVLDNKDGCRWEFEFLGAGGGSPENAENRRKFIADSIANSVSKGYALLWKGESRGGNGCLNVYCVLKKRT